MWSRHASISASSRASASRPEYQPLTQATPNSASFAFSAAGSRGNLLPSSKPS
jgi:hypothetical protein